MSSSQIKNDFSEIAKRFVKQIIHQIKKGEVAQASLSLNFLETFASELSGQVKSLKYVLDNSETRKTHQNPKSYPVKCFLSKTADKTVTLTKNDYDLLVVFHTINTSKTKTFHFKDLIADQIFKCLTFEDVLKLCIQYNQPKKNPYYYEVTV